MIRLFSRQRRWWLAVLQVILLLATSVAPAVAASDAEPSSGMQLVQLLQFYDIVRGDTKGNLNLDKPITRAEMVTIMVRALGKEKEAQMYKGWGVFLDAKGHWGEGNLTFAASKTLIKGDGNNNVRPDDPITYGEALTLILRLVGKEPSTGEWPVNVLIAAADLRLVPPGISAGDLKSPAVRGLMFQSMGTAITTVQTTEGKTFLQTYVDPTPPVISLTKPPETTKDATLRVSGTVQDAKTVTVNGKVATVTGNVFTADVSLEYGTNKITVLAVDQAGNPATVEATVSRIHPVSTLEITGPSKVRPGGTATYIVAGKDASGKAVSTIGATAKIEGNIGTFDLETGTFAASSAPGKGKITITAGVVKKSMDVEIMGLDQTAARVALRPINDGQAVAFTKPMTVTVDVQNANGELLSNDYGRPVTLAASGLTGLSVSPATAYSEAGLATFTVRSGSVGFASLQAASDKLVGDFRQGEFGSTLRVRLTAEPSTLTVGGANSVSRIKATLVDENGNPVNNQSGSDISVNLSFSGGNGSLVDSFLRIPVGNNSSSFIGDDGMYAVGSVAGSIRIKGTLTSNQNITVDSTGITTTVPSVGAGTFWDLLGKTNQTPSVQDSFLFRLSESTGSTIPGSYAFQLGVSTSNSELKTNGIPAGVELYMGNTRLNTTDTVLRTINGVATIQVKYDKPGQVYLSANSVPSTSTALGSDGSLGVAGSTSVAARTFTLNYAGLPTAVKLVVDSEGLGENNAVGSAPTNSTRGFTLRALLTNGTNWIPGTTADITLNQTNGGSTNLPLLTGVSAVDGKASYNVSVNGIAGDDTYTVTAVIHKPDNSIITATSNVVNLYVQNASPATPGILAIRGSSNAGPGSLNYLRPSDTTMDIELTRDTTQVYAVVKVFTENSGTPVYTSAPVDLTSSAPRISVPKSVLPNGVYRYQVVVKNGFGESARSLASSQVTNSTFVTNIPLSYAKFQWTTNQLTIFGANFTASDSVNPALITIKDSERPGMPITLSGATVVPGATNYSQLTLNLTGATELNNLKNPARFSGSDVRLSTSAGWYTRSNGEQASDSPTPIPVGPMAYIDHVEYDPVNSRLYLIGDGFNSINLDITRLKLQLAGNPVNTEIALNGYGANRLDDKTWSIPLDGTAVTKLNGNVNYKLIASDSWGYDGGYALLGFGFANNTELSVYAQIALSGVAYNSNTKTISIFGTGFALGTISPGQLANLKVTDLGTIQEASLNGTATVISDGQIDVVMTTDVLANPSLFNGSDVYLIGSAGWFTNGAGRPAAAIPLRALLLPTLPTP